MKYNYDFEMKYTDNPYIDIIVQCVKILGMNAIVKNENQALHYEDVRSATYANEYMEFKEGARDKSKGDYWEEMYFEWNSYYRMLNGLPPMYTLEEEKAYMDATGYDDSIYEDVGNAWVIPELYKQYFIGMDQYSVPEDMTNVLNLSGKYLHELSDEELSIVESCGIMKQILSEYGDDPHYQYIYHLGDKRIDFYTARKANNFSLIWVPKLDTFDIIENKFKRIFDRNRQYTIATVYSEAYRFMSYHYDSFIQILIIIQTMVDMISEVQEYIINKEVFDSRTIRYLFESYGIAYYKEIPTKYQIRIIKNVNNLLKYKSSHKNIIDILELFDDTSVKIYTYYLMKIKKINRNDFFYYTEEDVNPKYGTDRDYWLGNKHDISNNKVPLTNVAYNTDDGDFINNHIYNYKKRNPSLPDGRNNRTLLENQVIASMISRALTSLTIEQPTNSLIDGYMRRGDVNWFGVDEYVADTIQTSYLEKRNTFLTEFGVAIAERIKLFFDNECRDDNQFGLNGYYYKKVKYKLYYMLGIFDLDAIGSDDFDSMTEDELQQYFYKADDLVNDRYRIKHGIPENEYGSDSVDRFILNHTIPYMTLYNYKTRESEIYEDMSHLHCYIFNNTASFNVTIDLQPDMYEKWQKSFREMYIIAIKSYVESIFEDYKIDEVNNPTPQYYGWMDLNYVVGQLHKGIDEFELGDKVTTKNRENIPIYNSSYITHVVTKDMVGQEFFRKNYDLTFLKVPILDPNAYKVLERNDLRRGYDTITLADPFWDGVTTFDIFTEEERARLHESKKQEILSKDFTIERTKYIGVEASIDLTKMTYQICYFMNMLYDKYKDEENLYIDIDSNIVSSGRVRLNDILTFAIALNYLYQGVEPDNIASDMEKNMYVNGFNFDTDWNDIYNYLQNQRHIYNNYLNKPDKTYTYVDEYGETHEVVNGYGMDQLEKGWMTEIYDCFLEYTEDIKVYLGDAVKPDGTDADRRIPTDYDESTIPSGDELKVGAFLSGRYEQCPNNCATSEHLNLEFGSSDIWNYNLCNAVKYNWSTGEMSTFDISWKPTQYPSDDNNSHGLWLNTAILNTMQSDASDIEKINMLKKIYYTNTNLHDHLVYMMRTAESKRMYDIYKVLYDSFMAVKLDFEYYKLTSIDGIPIFTDSLDDGSTYSVVEVSYYVKDSEGFPYYDLNDLTDINNTVRYHFVHNADFSNCRYVSTNDSVECSYNQDIYRREGRKEYYVSGDYPEEFERGYMTPENIYVDQDKYFVLAQNTINMLQNSNNPNIMIPVTVDENNNIDFIEGVTEYNGYTITVTRISDTEIHINIVNDDVLDEPIDFTANMGYKVATDYYEFMQYRNIDLYNHLIDIKYNYTNNWDPVLQAYVPSDEKRIRIENLCESIAMSLEEYFDKNEWRGIFDIIPTANSQIIQSYIMKIVTFFKSWKTQVLDTSVSYTIDDTNDNYVHILDDMYYNITFTLLEKMGPKDYKYFRVYTEDRDIVDVKEKVDLKIVNFDMWWVTFGFGEKLYGHRFEYPEFKTITTHNDVVNPSEKIEINTVEYTGEVIQDENGNYLFP